MLMPNRASEMPKTPATPSKTTRPEHATGEVSCGGLDELLDATPEHPEHRRGRLGGLQKGRRTRLRFGLAALATLGLLWMGVQWWQADIESHRFDIPFAADIPSPEAAIMHWSAGNARLGLHKDGVRHIQTPDALISLAPGHAHAQVWVEVRDGKLARLKEIVGKVQIEPASKR